MPSCLLFPLHFYTFHDMDFYCCPQDLFSLRRFTFLFKKKATIMQTPSIYWWIIIKYVLWSMQFIRCIPVIVIIFRAWALFVNLYLLTVVWICTGTIRVHFRTCTCVTMCVSLGSCLGRVTCVLLAPCCLELMNWRPGDKNDPKRSRDRLLIRLDLRPRMKHLLKMKSTMIRNESKMGSFWMSQFSWRPCTCFCLRPQFYQLIFVFMCSTFEQTMASQIPCFSALLTSMFWPTSIFFLHLWIALVHVFALVWCWRLGIWPPDHDYTLWNLTHIIYKYFRFLYVLIFYIIC